MPVLRRAAVSLLIWVAAAAYGWWRVPKPARNRIWAEDGLVFLSDALAGKHPWTPYAGYLHLVPRLAADAIVACVPPGSYDQATTAVSVFLVALICALTFQLTAGVLETTWVRCVIALVPVALPAAGHEVLGNLANLHGFGLWLAFWLVMHRPAGWRSATGWALVALLVALTEIVVVLLVPLMVVGWRDRERWLPRALLLAGGVVQLIVSRTQPRPVQVETGGSPLDVAVGFAGQVGSAGWVGDGHLAARIVDVAGPAGLVVLLLLPAAAVCLVLAACAGERRRDLVIGLVLTSVMVWSISVFLNHFSWMDFAAWGADDWEKYGLLRYATTSGLFLAALPFVALDLARTRRQTVVALAVAALLLSAALVGARTGPVPREGGPRWPAEKKLVGLCAADPDGTLLVGIAPIAPQWSLTLPCERVR